MDQLPATPQPSPENPPTSHLEVTPHAGEAPWFADGLKFRCTQCGNCCTGSPGNVWLSEQELRDIATFLNTSTGEIRIHHTKISLGQLSLKDYANGDCTFFDGHTRHCQVYPVRPAQCRTWPFWGQNLETPTEWEMTCKACPGAGKGDLIPLEQIQARVKESRL